MSLSFGGSQLLRAVTLHVRIRALDQTLARLHMFSVCRVGGLGVGKPGTIGRPACQVESSTGCEAYALLQLYVHICAPHPAAMCNVGVCGAWRPSSQQAPRARAHHANSPKTSGSNRDLSHGSANCSLALPRSAQTLRLQAGTRCARGMREACGISVASAAPMLAHPLISCRPRG